MKILSNFVAFYTVKLGDKERFDKEQIGVKEPFPMTNLLHKDKEHLALRNSFRVTKKFLSTKFDFSTTSLSIASFTTSVWLVLEGGSSNIKLQSLLNRLLF